MNCFTIILRLSVGIQHTHLFWTLVPKTNFKITFGEYTNEQTTFSFYYFRASSRRATNARNEND
jgi:hypothetical protein